MSKPLHAQNLPYNFLARTLDFRILSGNALVNLRVRRRFSLMEKFASRTAGEDGIYLSIRSRNR
jgi:hypothetical protein